MPAGFFSLPKGGCGFAEEPNGGRGSAEARARGARNAVGREGGSRVGARKTGAGARRAWASERTGFALAAVLIARGGEGGGRGSAAGVAAYLDRPGAKSARVLSYQPV